MVHKATGAHSKRFQNLYFHQKPYKHGSHWSSARRLSGTPHTNRRAGRRRAMKHHGGFFGDIAAAGKTLGKDVWSGTKFLGKHIWSGTKTVAKAIDKTEIGKGLEQAGKGLVKAGLDTLTVMGDLVGVGSSVGHGVYNQMTGKHTESAQINNMVNQMPDPGVYQGFPNAGPGTPMMYGAVGTEPDFQQLSEQDYVNYLQQQDMQRLKNFENFKTLQSQNQMMAQQMTLMSHQQMGSQGTQVTQLNNGGILDTAKNMIGAQYHKLSEQWSQASGGEKALLAARWVGDTLINTGIASGGGLVGFGVIKSLWDDFMGGNRTAVSRQGHVQRPWNGGIAKQTDGEYFQNPYIPRARTTEIAVGRQAS